MTKGITIEHLDRTPGNVVVCISALYSTWIVGKEYTFDKDGKLPCEKGCPQSGSMSTFVPVGKGKTFGDMTPEEKGALLLAYHEGKTLEYKIHGDCEWRLTASRPAFADRSCYRVKPEPVVVEVVKYQFIKGCDVGLTYNCLLSFHTHKVAYTFIDGVYSSAKVEKL